MKLLWGEGTPSVKARATHSPKFLQGKFYWEDPLEKGTAIKSSIVAWRIPWTVYIVHGVAKSQTPLSDFHFHFQVLLFPLCRLENGNSLRLRNL